MTLDSIFRLHVFISGCLVYVLLVVGQFHQLFKEDFDTIDQPNAENLVAKSAKSTSLQRETLMSVNLKELKGKKSAFERCKDYDATADFTQMRQMKLRETLLLHMGKAGGGTVKNRAKVQWGLIVRQEHPYPLMSRLMEGNPSKKKAIWISVRDPVDRFISAFYWRKLVMCNPKNDMRERGPASKDPSKYCTEADDREKQIIFSRYGGDAGSLAAALCSLDPLVSSLAAEDMKHISHIQSGISDWLGQDLEKYSDILFPIVLEAPFSLDSQIDDAVRWTYSVTHFEAEDVFSKRQEALIAMECQHFLSTQVERNSTEINAASITLYDDSRHSSASIKKSLSQTDEACMVKFFSSEYNLLRHMRNRFCKTDTCYDAIQAILERRKK
uniref:Sulfotransferase domain-containing protein n=1 Tax=Pseudictyota dubia TaxID=2749911 RepID=A0A7R9ZDJ6_9STRA|mmetsp:Transcript_40804/g.75519  ORF Transcript_40804/g.75519 Transcript_40804/m.75519 type:complete len:385 (+) Transcript_40804:344-1498(+)